MRRFRNLTRNGPYRSRNGAILGVCRGLAEYFDFSVFWTRTIVVILLLVTGLWPITGLYFLAALLMKPEPVIPIHSEEEREFYDSYATSRHRAAQRLKRRYKNLERRIQRMEHAVTSKDFNWENRM
ncbi:MAG: envelope stress response membrane protein PspC [Deltaproteobacteria bacterium]|nr:MAG: envelope stress response membrane protein PspC [Deltaproteobacteria bacterium]